MRRLSIAALVLLLASADAGPPAPGKAEAAELVRLKGAWKVVRLQVGKKARELLALEWTLDFQGDRWTMKHPDGTGTGKVRLDLAGRPPRMDLIGDKGQLRLCWWPRRRTGRAPSTPRSRIRPGC
jgi:uncharacterized protein (TIGR03067 family)